MKELVRKYLFIFFIIIAAIIIFMIRELIEGLKEGVPVDIGNFMILYICNLVDAINKKVDFDANLINSWEQTGHGLDKKYDFLKWLPRKISFNDALKPYSEKFISENLGSNQPEKCETPYFRFTSIETPKIFEIIKPLVHKIIDDALSKTDLNANVKLNHPVIHFRCADTPFVQNPDYKLRRFAYFEYCLKGTNYDEITILSYTQHRSNEVQQKLCTRWCKELGDFLKNKLGYKKVNIKNQSNVDDYAKMFYAPLVISTGGSYALTSGFFGYGKFFMPKDWNMEEGVVTPEWLVEGYNIEHNSVDYYDEEKVVAKMKEI